MRWGSADGKSGKAALCAVLLASVPLALAQRRTGGTVRPPRAMRQANGVPPVVKRALDSAKTLRFVGRRTVTVLRNGQPNRHEEIVMRDGPLVRVEFPSDEGYAGQVIVEDGTVRRHYIPKSNEVRILPARGEEGLQRLRAMARLGNVVVENGERIAGWPTSEVVVRDRPGNVLQRLAIEPNSGMVLRRRIFDATGVEAGGYVFTKIDLSPAPFDPALFRIDRKGAKSVTPYDDLRRLAKRNAYALVSLPETSGFRLDRVQAVRLGGPPILVQTYVGPGGRLTLYQLRATVDIDSLRRQGGARLRSLSWTDEGVTVVLLGPQNDATLAKLRDALVRG